MNEKIALQEHIQRRERQNLLGKRPVGVFEIDLTGKIRSFNHAFKRSIYPWSKTDIVGKSLAEISDAGGRDYVADCVSRTLSGESLQFELFVNNADKTYYYSIVLEPAIGDDGKVIKVIGISEELSEKFEVDDNFLHSQKFKSLSQLTGKIAHDFNNALAVIIGSLERISHGSGGVDRNRKRITRALNAAENGATLSQLLLSLSQQPSISPEAISIKDLIFDAALIAKRVMTDDVRIEIENELASTLVKIDRQDFIFVIHNITLNAMEAMSTGGVFSMSASVVDLERNTLPNVTVENPGEYFLLTLTDNGCGISEKDIGYVFTPFFSINKVELERGIALSMVYACIRRSDGYISIESAPDIRTAVRLYIPVWDTSSHDKRNDGAKPNPKSVAQKIVLLVDDDAAVRETTASTLLELGCEVYEAEDSEVALNLLNLLKDQGENVDLVFSDIEMPNGLNGYDLAREILTNNREQKILLTSGFSDSLSISENERQEFLAQVHFLPKPFRRAKLKTVLYDIIGR